MRPEDDFDGDGLSSGAEFIAGTLATDPGSRFALAVPAAQGDGPITIRWIRVPGKTYTVHRSLDLTQGFTVLAEDLTETDFYTDVPPSKPVFYMISVR